MSIPELLFGCVLAVLEGGVGPKECEVYPLVAEVTSAISSAAEENNLPAAMIAAVAFHESGFNPKAISADGQDLGLMQVRRGGAIQGRLLRLTDRALQNVRLNVGIGAGYLARMARSCPRYFLSRYNGRPCRPSIYSRAVLVGLRDTQARFATYLVDAKTQETPMERADGSALLRPSSIDREPGVRGGEEIVLLHIAQLPSLRVRMPGLWIRRRRYDGRPFGSLIDSVV